jgi:hypothetical protein
MLIDTIKGVGIQSDTFYVFVFFECKQKVLDLQTITNWDRLNIINYIFFKISWKVSTFVN